MKRLSGVVMAACLIGAAACDDSPTDPGSTAVFTVNMTAAQEVPPVTGAEAGATGSATITFNLTRNSANVITAATANFASTVNNMPAGSTLVMAHIHTGAAGVAGPPVVDTGLTAAAAIPIVNGSATLTANNVTADPATVQNIIDNPAGFYFNVHSAANLGGVVRGQLVRQGT
jgi:hypothetical protein